MRPPFPKLLAGIFLLIALGAGVVLFGGAKEEAPELPPFETAKEASKIEDITPSKSVIGASVEGRTIESYTYGSGATHLLFVGGVHGGYEWNSVLLAYQLIDHLEKNLNVIPANLTVTIIPSVNPDGVYRVVGKEGRFTREDV